MSVEARGEAPAVDRSIVRLRDPMNPVSEALRSGSRTAGRLLASAIIVIALASACEGGGGGTSSILSLELDPSTVALPLDGR